ncbi:Myb domain containing protein [Arabidopsis thaliana x Arabidopsis arenosa]|uniref:Myb domain containing protein n=1 Tax=Arabidopsis thaliana x Arabidopsis arenosa TaxID=1240361 RepID=A0A8T1XKF6_9BRAS|nr:Myb domain containing protein [Arabidopsis thaliana x Arabidopsis arenosa]
MEVLRPTTSHVSGGNWLMDETKSAVAASGEGATWTAAENKAFENALAVYDDNTPDRWQKVAAVIPGKTVSDVIRQYNDLEADVSSIEAGLIPVPGYITSPPFTLDWAGGGCNGFKPGHQVCNKRSPAGRSPELERKKGVPWTEEEHKLFLMGLKKYGKGDWRNISRNFVITRTPTQVASHAQKYFIRQLPGGKDKRRASIHDITTVNLEDEASLETNKSSIVVGEQRSRLTAFPWNPTDNNGTHADAFNITIGNAISGVHSYGQVLLGGFNNADSCYDAQNTMFQL